MASLMRCPLNSNIRPTITSHKQRKIDQLESLILASNINFKKSSYERESITVHRFGSQTHRKRNKQQKNNKTKVRKPSGECKPLITETKSALWRLQKGSNIYRSKTGMTMHQSIWPWEGYDHGMIATERISDKFYFNELTITVAEYNIMMKWSCTSWKARYYFYTAITHNAANSTSWVKEISTDKKCKTLKSKWYKSKKSCRKSF